MNLFEPGTRVVWADGDRRNPIGKVCEPSRDDYAAMFADPDALALFRGRVLVDFSDVGGWERAWYDPRDLRAVG